MASATQNTESPSVENEKDDVVALSLEVAPSSQPCSEPQLSSKWSATVSKVPSGRLASLRERIEHHWHGLPTAGKATLVLAVLTTLLLVTYSITAVSLPTGEQAHIATVIIFMSLFNLYAVGDAVIFENTLQLVSSIILSSLMLARVLWFISSGPSTSNTAIMPLFVTWGSLIAAVQVAFILSAVVSARQFGWRLYSRLNVDYRNKAAGDLQRLALMADAFNTLVKLDFAFLVTITALGLDVSMEKRGQVDGALLGISLASLFVGTAAAALGVAVASSERWRRRILLFDVLVPLSCAGPIALMAVYSIQRSDPANAFTSVLIGCSVYLMTRISLWIALHLVTRHSSDITFAGGRITLRSSTAATDTALNPLLQGAWLGKPSPRNPRKIRFFQLSHDGSTLRWGWKTFVRLYYVQDVLYAPSALTLTLTFVLDEELTLRFPDVDTLARWRQGLDHLLVRLLDPGTDSDARTSGEISSSGRLHPRNAMPIEGCVEEGKMSKEGATPTIEAARAASSQEGCALDGHDDRLSSEGAVSEGQLQKRQRMAAILQAASSAVGWFNVSRSPRATAVKGGEKYFNTDEDAVEEFSLVKRRRAELLVSSSTQTEDEEFPAFMARSRQATADSVVADDGNVDLALQYASLMAAAAAAEGGAPGQHAAMLPSVTAVHAGMATTTSPSYTPNPSSSYTGIVASHPPQYGATTTPGPPHRSSSFAGRGGGPPPSMPTNALLTISVDVVDFDDLQLGKILGVGSEGSVHAAWYLDTPVAVKQFNRVEDSLHEVGMYLGVGSHDNVLALRALCQHEGSMYLVLEFCPRGTLDALLHHSAPQQWDPARLLPLVRSIARGMHHLHSRGIVHRDLKPANIFVGHGQTMKVGDFGMARYADGHRQDGGPMGNWGSVDQDPRAAGLMRLSPGVIGTPQYAAPELINDTLRPDCETDAVWATKIDVWSFGVTLWEIIERRRPFEGQTSVAVESLWLNSPYQARLPPVRVPDSLDASGKRVLRGLSDLVEDCTRLDPLARPGFGEVLLRLRGLGGVHRQ